MFRSAQPRGPQPVGLSEAAPSRYGATRGAARGPHRMMPRMPYQGGGQWQQLPDGQGYDSGGEGIEFAPRPVSQATTQSSRSRSREQGGERSGKSGRKAKGKAKSDRERGRRQQRGDGDEEEGGHRATKHSRRRSRSRSRDAASHRRSRGGTTAGGGAGAGAAVHLNLAAMMSQNSMALLGATAVLMIMPIALGGIDLGFDFGGSSTPSFHAKRGSKPNFVLFFPDDMGYNDVTYTNPNIEKPFETTNIDQLAYEGVRLSNYYTTPNCAPSRCAVMTGRYTLRNGCQHTDPDYKPWGVPLTESFIPEVLKSVGYYNVMLGKWHLGMFTTSYTPTGRGFDEFVGFLGGGEDHFDHDEDDGYDWWNGNKIDKSAKGTFSTVALNNSMWDFMANRGEAKQPWFMYVPTQAPHGPYEAPKRWRRLLSNKFDDIGSEECAWAAMMLMLDDFVGSTVRALKQYNMYHRTMVVYAGDHGAEQYGVDYDGNAGRCYPFSGEKGELWEGGVRVPAFIHAPFLHSNWKGAEMTTLTSVYDWLPTFAALAGVDTSKFPTSDGADLSPLLINNKNAPSRDHVLISLDNMCEDDDDWDKPNAAIRVGDYKMLAACVTTDGDVEGDVWLFDIGGGDYTESTNLMETNFANNNANLITYIKGLLSTYAQQAVEGLGDDPPWQGDDYWCAECEEGCPTNGMWKPYYNDYGQYIGGDCEEGDDGDMDDEDMDMD